MILDRLTLGHFIVMMLGGIMLALIAIGILIFNQSEKINKIMLRVEDAYQQCHYYNYPNKDEYEAYVLP